MDEDEAIKRALMDDFYNTDPEELEVIEEFYDVLTTGGRPDLVRVVGKENN